MFEDDATPAVRMEIVEIKTLFDVLQEKDELRVEFVARLKAKLKETDYDENRRQGLQRAIERMSQQYELV